MVATSRQLLICLKFHLCDAPRLASVVATRVDELRIGTTESAEPGKENLEARPV